MALREPKNLTDKIINLLNDPNNIAFISVASLWELQIKKSLNKIELPEKFVSRLQECGYELLDVSANHVERLATLPLLHRDPFDRIIISQSLHENIPLITKDNDI